MLKEPWASVFHEKLKQPPWLSNVHELGTFVWFRVTNSLISFYVTNKLPFLKLQLSPSTDQPTHAGLSVYFNVIAKAPDFCLEN